MPKLTLTGWMLPSIVVAVIGVIGWLIVRAVGDVDRRIEALEESASKSISVLKSDMNRRFDEIKHDSSQNEQQLLSLIHFVSRIHHEESKDLELVASTGEAIPVSPFTAAFIKEGAALANAAETGTVSLSDASITARTMKFYVRALDIQGIGDLALFSADIADNGNELNNKYWTFRGFLDDPPAEFSEVSVDLREAINRSLKKQGKLNDQ